MPVIIPWMYLKRNQRILMSVGIFTLMFYHVLVQLKILRRVNEQGETFVIITSTYMPLVKDSSQLVSMKKYLTKTAKTAKSKLSANDDVMIRVNSKKYNKLSTKEIFDVTNSESYENNPKNIRKRLLVNNSFLWTLMGADVDRLKRILYSFTKNPRSIIRRTLERSLREDKGTGCDVPELDPFSTDVAQFDKPTNIIKCKSHDWVKCNFTKCSIVLDAVKDLKNEVNCTFKDILYRNEDKHDIGSPTVIKGDQVYVLDHSDHVKVECLWRSKHNNATTKWSGIAIGHRPVRPIKPPKGRDSPNVLIFGFDSVSRNTFIRKMPKSYKFITEVLQAVVLKKYNIIGDATTPALFALLAGISENEHPECRRNFNHSSFVENKKFIFNKVKKYGYRTAYYEDMPWIGSFQHRLKGFRYRPTDHYLRDAFMHEKDNYNGRVEHCFFGTPRFKIMMDLTSQFFKLDGKRFAFTFMGDLTHEDFNTISNADEPLVEFLKGIKQDGRLNDTLLIVMSDHGSRYSDIRKIYQGKLEERLPLMAIRLPDVLTTRRPEAAMYLKRNVDTLTTPFDIYTTILDVIDLKKYWNNDTIEGADFPRAMTLLNEIPKTRACSEAGILPHWCSCLKWEILEPMDPIYNRTAQALVDHINQLTQFQRNKCAIRTLTSIDEVVKKKPNKRLLQSQDIKVEYEIHIGRFGKAIPVNKQLYQVKITSGPGDATFEATVTHDVKQDKIYVNTKEISRTNAYKDEPACVSAIYPHLNKFCYCL